MNLPNILTLTRVLLIPVFVILIINKYFEWALLTFAIAGITDGLDGLIARLTHQRTELGAYLDPIADKLLTFAAFISLAIIEMIPSWLVVIVITRDIIILIGFLVMFLTNYHPKINPSFLSKMTTTFQIVTILFALLAGLFPAFKQLSMLAFYGTAIITILSGTQYIYIGTGILNGKR
ncbi:MAG: CDP-diacylglycerol--glycerol-3-phosphate 3-phosphatidyltransferase [Desulfobacterales bacterium]|nr:CDP-diacylglycerol--glycerol-3-phosphate 3-phosphatidyltransferase [Desulfobacterales bacterium]